MAHPPNASFPSVNISFVKEVTVTVGPEDVQLSPRQEQEITGLLESGMRLFDPILRFFDSLWASPPPGQRDGTERVV
jgi:hypothetical protein